MCATKIVCVSPSVLKRSIEDRLAPTRKQLILKYGTCNGVDTLSQFNPDLIQREKIAKLKTKYGITLLFCEGGPQSPVSQFWSYRWNFQIMAANDYIIIAPNRRGLPGFGMEWLEEISTNYGGHCMDDYLTAIDDIAKEPYVDKDRLGCVAAERRVCFIPTSRPAPAHGQASYPRPQPIRLRSARST